MKAVRPIVTRCLGISASSPGCFVSRSCYSTVSTEQDVSKARAYCETQLGHGDRNALLVHRFLPHSSRDLYLALRTLNLELVRLPDTVATPGLRSIRVAFWGDSIAHTFAGHPPREPICTLLAHSIDTLTTRDPDMSLSSLRFWITRLVKARGEMADNRPHVSLEALEDVAERTYASVTYATLAAAGVRSTEADHLGSHVAKAVGIVAALRGVSVLAVPGKKKRDPVLLLPLDVLARNGVREEDVFRRGPEARGLTDAMFEIATRAHDHLLTAREMIGSLKKGQDVGHEYEYAGEEEHQHGDVMVSEAWGNVKKSLGVYLEGVPALDYLEMLEKANFDPFKIGSGWKVPWRMWRAYSKETI